VNALQLPVGVQVRALYLAGVCSQAANPSRAEAFVETLCDGRTAPELERAGLQPVSGETH